MCVPIDTAVQAGASMWAARQQARTGTMQAGAFVEEARQNMEALSARGRQQRTAIREQIGQRAIDMQRSLGRINAVLSESNLMGATADRLRAEVAGSAAMDTANLQESAFNASEQTRRAIQAAGTNVRSNINNITRPSAVEPTLRVFGSGLTSTAPTLIDLWNNRGRPPKKGASNASAE
jgi:hypothetical protein